MPRLEEVEVEALERLGRLKNTLPGTTFNRVGAALVTET